MNSPLAYVGGKSRIANQIIQMMPQHKTYCEVFAGAAWVFFRKEPSKYEIINDLDGDLINFFRVIQHHYEEFCRHFEWVLPSKETFLDYKNQLRNCRGLTDIQRAVRYYYLQKQCFGGVVRKHNWGVGTCHNPRINLQSLEENIRNVHSRLKGVVIENETFERFIEKYDRPYVLFYCDPPYWKKPEYNHNFEESDFVRLADILSGIQGKFILSVSSIPEMREIYSKFNIFNIKQKYTVNREGKNKKVDELIITNYDQDVCLNGMADPDVSKMEKSHNKKKAML